LLRLQLRGGLAGCLLASGFLTLRLLPCSLLLGSNSDSGGLLLCL
jgi:hypothetical protein